MASKSALITVEPNRFKNLESILSEKGFTVYTSAFIQFEPIDFEIKNKSATWVFFSSPNAVKFFLKKVEEAKLSKLKIAVLGSGTLEKLKKYNLNPHFIGNNANTIEIAKTFSKLLSENDTVLIPESDISLQKISKTLSKVSKAKIEIIKVYKTILKKISVDNSYNILIFTSPSNVEAYFSSNKITASSQIISIGNSTSKKLSKYTNNKVLTAKYPNEESIIKIINDLE